MMKKVTKKVYLTKQLTLKPLKNQKFRDQNQFKKEEEKHPLKNFQPQKKFNENTLVHLSYSKPILKRKEVLYINFAISIKNMMKSLDLLWEVYQSTKDI